MNSKPPAFENPNLMAWIRNQIFESLIREPASFTITIFSSSSRLSNPRLFFWLYFLMLLPDFELKNDPIKRERETRRRRRAVPWIETNSATPTALSRNVTLQANLLFRSHQGFYKTAGGVYQFRMHVVHVWRSRDGDSQSGRRAVVGGQVVEEWTFRGVVRCQGKRKGSKGEEGGVIKEEIEVAGATGDYQKFYGGGGAMVRDVAEAHNHGGDALQRTSYLGVLTRRNSITKCNDTSLRDDSSTDSF